MKTNARIAIVKTCKVVQKLISVLKNAKHQRNKLLEQIYRSDNVRNTLQLNTQKLIQHDFRVELAKVAICLILNEGLVNCIKYFQDELEVVLLNPEYSTNPIMNLTQQIQARELANLVRRILKEDENN
jgi:hypothetical protein